MAGDPVENWQQTKPENTIDSQFLPLNTWAPIQYHYHYDTPYSFIVSIKRTSVNWNEKVKKDDLVTIDGEDTIRLKALQRMGREAGLIKSEIKINNITNTDCTKLLVQAIYTIEFEDGSKWIGCADASPKSVDGKFARYLTAMAESRAEARALRKALGIEMLSAEEIDLQPESTGESPLSKESKSDPQQIRLIQGLLEKADMSVMDLFKQCLPDDRISLVVDLKDLTFGEAVKCAKYLNEVFADKARSSKTDRDKRKEILKRNIEGD